MNRRRFLFSLVGAAASVTVAASIATRSPALATPPTAQTAVCNNSLFSGELGRYNGIVFHQDIAAIRERMEQFAIKPVRLDGEDYYALVCDPDTHGFMRDALWRRPPAYQQLDLWT